MPKHWTYLAILPCLALAACTLTAPFSEAAPDRPPPSATAAQGVEYTAPPSSQSPLAAPTEPSSLLVTPDATLIPPTLANTPIPFDGGDGHETTLVQPISLNEPQTATL
jgi:hypothetical protein